jgi:hypothetical protein
MKELLKRIGVEKVTSHDFSWADEPDSDRVKYFDANALHFKPQGFSWADELEKERPEVRGYEPAVMSRTLRPLSNRSSVVGGCRNINTIHRQTCCFR